MKIYLCNKLSKTIYILFVFVSLIFTKGEILNAESFFKESQDSISTKTEEEASVIPTNPFEIVEMIRRYNSMNDATKPSDAIDDALNSFNTLEEKKEI